MTQRKGSDEMIATKEIKDEMVGVLTAISIVSKRLASRLLNLDKEGQAESTSCEESENNNELVASDERKPKNAKGELKDE